MVNTKIKLIILFAAKDEEALYSQQKQDWELTVVQIMNSLLHTVLDIGKQHNIYYLSYEVNYFYGFSSQVLVLNC